MMNVLTFHYFLTHFGQQGVVSHGSQLIKIQEYIQSTQTVYCFAVSFKGKINAIACVGIVIKGCLNFNDAKLS